jgi:hypothetical protein
MALCRYYGDARSMPTAPAVGSANVFGEPAIEPIDVRGHQALQARDPIAFKCGKDIGGRRSTSYRKAICCRRKILGG